MLRPADAQDRLAPANCSADASGFTALFDQTKTTIVRAAQSMDSLVAVSASFVALEQLKRCRTALAPLVTAGVGELRRLLTHGVYQIASKADLEEFLAEWEALLEALGPGVAWQFAIDQLFFAEAAAAGGQAEEAQQRVDAVIARLERIYSESEIDLATALNEAASWGIQRFDRAAVRLYRRAYDIRRRVLDPGSVDTLTSAANLAIYLFRTDDGAGAAQRVFQEVLRAGEDGAWLAVKGKLLADTAQFLSTSKRDAEAEAALRRALALFDRAEASSDGSFPQADRLQALQRLGAVLRKTGRSEELVALLAPHIPPAGANQQASDKAKGPVLALYSAGLAARGQTDEARQVLLRAFDVLETGEAESVEPMTDVARTLQPLLEAKADYAGLAALFERQARHMEQLGMSWNLVAESWMTAAQYTMFQGRRADAEQAVRVLLARPRDDASPGLIATLKLMLALLLDQGELAERDSLYDQAMAHLNRGGDFQQVTRDAALLGLFAFRELDNARPEQAVALGQRALALLGHVPDVNEAAPNVRATVLMSLGVAYRTLKRLPESEQALRQAIPLFERGGQSFNADSARSALADVLLVTNQEEAEHLASTILKRRPYDALSIKALLAGQRKQWSEAAQLSAEAFAALQRVNLHQSRFGVSLLAARTGALIELEQLGLAFETLERELALLEAIALEDAKPGRRSMWAAKSAGVGLSLIFEFFIGRTEETPQAARMTDVILRLAQIANLSSSNAAFSLANARAGLPATAARDAQTLEQIRDDMSTLRERINAQLANPTPIEGQLPMLQARLQQLDSEAGQLITALNAQAPAYAAALRERPLGLNKITAALRHGESVVVLFTVPPELMTNILALAITRTADAVSYYSAMLGKTEDIVPLIARLRSSIGAGGGGSARGGDAQNQLGDEVGTGPRGFDFDAAHALYQQLLAPLGKDVAGSSDLIIVPQGELSRLPFNLLITDKPAPDVTARTAQWLPRKHALTILPGVQNLHALRTTLRPGAAAPMPFIGFGDPEIGRAPAFDPCTPVPAITASAGSSQLRSPTPNTVEASSGASPAKLADVAWVRAQPRLPRSRCELEAIARDQGPGSRIFTGAEATEATVKRLSSTGELGQYRVVSFATHGLLPGQASGLDAALMLTPPATASAEDDGLITASEIAGLHLSADWVILSACNTAAGEAPDAESLSGLARAFFFAGARALLVSHWPIDDRAAALLTSHIFQELFSNPGLSRAEALRRTMVWMIDEAGRSLPAAFADPRMWGAFALVGDGGTLAGVSAAR